jgi:DNA-directed RNA polymerase subunit M/transcription elongation factor TFIIS
MANIVKKEVKTYKIYAYCEKCGGLMWPTGKISTSLPLQFQHKCHECGHTELFLEAYPSTEYEEI